MSHRKQSSDHLNLYRAIEKGDNEIVKELINKGANVNSNVGSDTPLHWAVIKSTNVFFDLDIINTLLDYKANIYARNRYGNKPLHIAILRNKTNAALLLIKRGALVGENLNWLLIAAIKDNNLTIVKMLIDQGMRDNPSTDLKISLETAISQKYPAMIKYIIPHCQFLKPSDKYIPRVLVMESGGSCKECIEVLLEWNFTINPKSPNDEDFIYASVKEGYLLIVIELLKLKINVNKMNSCTELNLLTIACLNKHYEIVVKLLEHNANVNEIIPSENRHVLDHLGLRISNKKFWNEVTCLHIAVFNNDQKITELLLRYCAKTMNASTLFNVACIAVDNNCEEIVRMLLDYGVNMTDIDPDGKTLLHVCVNSNTKKRNARYNIAKLFLEKGAHIHIQTPNNSLVFETIVNKCPEVTQLFLDYNADVQYISPNGDTILHKAIRNNYDVEFIKTLMKLNPSVNAINRFGFTPLFVAIKYRRKNRFEVIEALTHYNADIYYNKISLMTALHWACENQNMKFVKMLLKNGANPNVVDKSGKTSLHYCCTSRSKMDPKIIQILLEHDANIEALDEKDCTPLLEACYLRCNDTIVSLLNHDANVNHISYAEYSTPLHVAVDYASVKMTKVLIKYGANINILHGKNQTPLQKAIQNMILSCNENSHAYFYEENYEKIIKILVLQGIKLKIAGLEVNGRNSKVVFNHDDYVTIDNVKYSAVNILQLNVSFNFNEDILSDIDSSHDEDSIYDIQQLKVKCEQEIKMMKGESIGIDEITFYDLLKKNIYFLFKFFEFEKIQQLLELEIYDKKFPLYIDIVRSRFRQTKIQYERRMLMNSAEELFSANISSVLPDECIDAIFNYFNIGELKMFIKAMKPLNA